MSDAEPLAHASDQGGARALPTPESSPDLAVNVRISPRIVDAFAGPGGWSEGLRLLGLEDVGIEWDLGACATRRAAGHLTIRADVSLYPPERFADWWGLLMSPPCQDFSMAGKRAGRSGEKGQLIDLVPIWIDTVRPQWFACEQVPGVLPIWQEFAPLAEASGYHVWTGILDAADYGVPQHRKRAFFCGARWPITAPKPTHERHPCHDLFGDVLERHVTMCEAIGWGLTDRPAYTFCGSNEGGMDIAGGSGARRAIKRAIAEGRWVVDRRTNSNDGRGGMVPTVVVPLDRPAPTLTGKAMGQWRIYREGDGRTWVKLTVEDALRLQSFRPDYPVQRPNQGEQIGNAVPPLLGAHVVAAITGRAIDPQEVAA